MEPVTLEPTTSRGRPRLTDAERQQIIALYLAHSDDRWTYTVDSVARRTGRAVTTVSSVVTAAGITRPLRPSRWPADAWPVPVLGRAERTCALDPPPHAAAPDCAGGSCLFGCVAVCARRQLPTAPPDPPDRPRRQPRSTRGGAVVKQPATAAQRPAPPPAPAPVEEVTRPAPAAATSTDAPAGTASRADQGPLPTLPERTRRWDTDWFTDQLGVFGVRVRAMRRSRGWSQQDVADRTGIGRRRVWAIESGKQNLTLEVLWRLANAFRVHWADLIDDRMTDAPRAHSPSVPFDPAAFGTRAYQARVLQRMSQQALTDRTGIGRSAISEIEAGTQNVTLETLSRLAAGLDVHWADLLDDRDPYPPRPYQRAALDGAAEDVRAGAKTK